MKKMTVCLSILLAIFLVIAPFCYAEGENSDTLANWGIRIAVPDNKTAVLKGNEYYIYAQEEGSIPYVMLTTYRFSSEEEFIPAFTEFMQGQYSDLAVLKDAEKKIIGGKSCYEIDYGYKVSGYDVRDRRIVITRDETTYLFASKEVEELGMTVGSMLEDVVANCTFLTDDDSEPTNEITVSPGLLYCLDNGMPKYWLDFTGSITENLLLHCYFRSSDPTFYESVFTLDLKTAELNGQEVVIHNVYDEYGFDHSNWFTTLKIDFESDSAVMIVERDENTLAGGGEDNILTGSYRMNQIDVSAPVDTVTPAGTSKQRTYPAPFGKGPFTPEALGRWAQIYYFTRSGFFPPEVDVEENADGSYSIHLYENVVLDGTSHTATSAWYTVDAYGFGANDITGEIVDIG